MFRAISLSIVFFSVMPNLFCAVSSLDSDSGSIERLNPAEIEKIVLAAIGAPGCDNEFLGFAKNEVITPQTPKASVGDKFREYLCAEYRIILTIQRGIEQVSLLRQRFEKFLTDDCIASLIAKKYSEYNFLVSTGLVKELLCTRFGYKLVHLVNANSFDEAISTMDGIITKIRQNPEAAVSCSIV